MFQVYRKWSVGLFQIQLPYDLLANFIPIQWYYVFKCWKKAMSITSNFYITINYIFKLIKYIGNNVQALKYIDWKKK